MIEPFCRDPTLNKKSTHDLFRLTIFDPSCWLGSVSELCKRHGYHGLPQRRRLASGPSLTSTASSGVMLSLSPCSDGSATSLSNPIPTCTRYHHIIMNFAMKQSQEFYPLNTNSTNMHQSYVGQGACLQVSGTLCRLVLPSWHTKPCCKRWKAMRIAEGTALQSQCPQVDKHLTVRWVKLPFEFEQKHEDDTAPMNIRNPKNMCIPCVIMYYHVCI